MMSFRRFSSLELIHFYYRERTRGSTKTNKQKHSHRGKRQRKTEAKKKDKETDREKQTERQRQTKTDGDREQVRAHLITELVEILARVHLKLTPYHLQCRCRVRALKANLLCQSDKLLQPYRIHPGKKALVTRLDPLRRRVAVRVYGQVTYRHRTLFVLHFLLVDGVYIADDFPTNRKTQYIFKCRRVRIPFFSLMRSNIFFKDNFGPQGKYMRIWITK